MISPGSHPRQVGKTAALEALAGSVHTAAEHRRMGHYPEIIPGPKMDAPGLVKAVCSCGGYTSGSGSENNVLGAHADHAVAKIAAEAKTGVPCVGCPAVVLAAYAARRAAAEAAGGAE